MVVYGYVRVSCRDQNPDRQCAALRQRGIAERHLFVDRVSGKNFSRPEYRKMLRQIVRGDLIVIKSIDRLGRNYKEILEQWRVITHDMGVHIEVLDMPLLNTAVEHNGLTGVFIADLVLQILAYVAETERSFIRQRQREGIAAARLRGAHFGRNRVTETDNFVAAYHLWKNGRLSTRRGAEICGMSHTTFYRRCKERQEAEETEKCFKE